MIFLKWLEELKEYYKKYMETPLKSTYSYEVLYKRLMLSVDEIIETYKQHEKNTVIFFEDLRKYCKFSSYRVNVKYYKCYSTKNPTIYCKAELCPILQDNRKNELKVTKKCCDVCGNDSKTSAIECSKCNNIIYENEPYENYNNEIFYHKKCLYEKSYKNV